MDKEVFALVNGVWIGTGFVGNEMRANFLIVCDYGDWSGFRTLSACLAQVPDNWASRPAGFYRIVER